MTEKWVHRADLAEAAVNDRHASKLWGLPRTNLAVIAWPPTTREAFFYRWHYWWQAHYIDCQLDAYSRRPTKSRRARLRATVKGMRIRNGGKLSKNRYYDDKAWLALALGRTEALPKLHKPKGTTALRRNIQAGVDPSTGVLPWREGETFFNVPTNGPAAIMLARTGHLEEARRITGWILDNLVNHDHLIMDGIRLRMHGPEIVTDLHPYCQGVTIGACLEVVLGLYKQAGVSPEDPLEDREHAALVDEAMPYITAIRSLVQAVATHMADHQGVINWQTGEGDGGMFKGILARYLADAALRLPGDSPHSKATRKLARRLVLASANSVWNHRLEVDGLPVFGTEWDKDARLPHNYGLGPRSLAETAGVIRIDERDLSVQLSGWMLMEAAARLEVAKKKR